MKRKKPAVKASKAARTPKQSAQKPQPAARTPAKGGKTPGQLPAAKPPQPRSSAQAKKAASAMQKALAEGDAVMPSGKEASTGKHSTVSTTAACGCHRFVSPQWHDLHGCGKCPKDLRLSGTIALVLHNADALLSQSRSAYLFWRHETPCSTTQAGTAVMDRHISLCRCHGALLGCRALCQPRGQVPLPCARADQGCEPEAARPPCIQPQDPAHPCRLVQEGQCVRGPEAVVRSHACNLLYCNREGRKQSVKESVYHWVCQRVGLSLDPSFHGAAICDACEATSEGLRTARSQCNSCCSSLHIHLAGTSGAALTCS